MAGIKNNGFEDTDFWKLRLCMCFSKHPVEI